MHNDPGPKSPEYRDSMIPGGNIVETELGPLAPSNNGQSTRKGGAKRPVPANSTSRTDAAHID